MVFSYEFLFVFLTQSRIVFLVNYAKLRLVLSAIYFVVLANNNVFKLDIAMVDVLLMQLLEPA